MKKNISVKKTALITGGAKRIGQAMCLALAQCGYSIALHYHRSRKDALKTAGFIRKKGGQCELFKCNLSNAKEAATLIKKVVKKLPNLNLLINNASVFEKSTLKNVTPASLATHFQTNFSAPLILSRDFANICKKGNIINILDTNIVKSRTHHLTYLLSKKALHELTKLSTVELAPRIRVNGVAPGLIMPPKGKKSDYLKRLAKSIPLRKKGDVQHIVHSILFLLDNPCITGQTLFNDGGEHLL